jgi:hypothetical protein
MGIECILNIICISLYIIHNVYYYNLYCVLLCRIYNVHYNLYYLLLTISGYRMYLKYNLYITIYYT